MSRAVRDAGPLSATSDHRRSCWRGKDKVISLPAGCGAIAFSTSSTSSSPAGSCPLHGQPAPSGVQPVNVLLFAAAAGFINLSQGSAQSGFRSRGQKMRLGRTLPSTRILSSDWNTKRSRDSPALWPARPFSCFGRVRVPRRSCRWTATRCDRVFGMGDVRDTARSILGLRSCAPHLGSPCAALQIIRPPGDRSTCCRRSRSVRSSSVRRG